MRKWLFCRHISALPGLNLISVTHLQHEHGGRFWWPFWWCWRLWWCWRHLRCWGRRQRVSWWRWSRRLGNFYRLSYTWVLIKFAKGGFEYDGANAGQEQQTFDQGQQQIFDQGEQQQIFDQGEQQQDFESFEYTNPMVPEEVKAPEIWDGAWTGSQCLEVYLRNWTFSRHTFSTREFNMRWRDELDAKRKQEDEARRARVSGLFEPLYRWRQLLLSQLENAKEDISQLNLERSKIKEAKMSSNRAAEQSFLEELELQRENVNPWERVVSLVRFTLAPPLWSHA